MTTTTDPDPPPDADPNAWLRPLIREQIAFDLHDLEQAAYETRNAINP